MNTAVRFVLYWIWNEEKWFVQKRPVLLQVPRALGSAQRFRVLTNRSHLVSDTKSTWMKCSMRVNMAIWKLSVACVFFFLYV